MIGWLTKIVAGGNDREAQRLRPLVQKINALEPSFAELTDEGLREKTAEFRRRLGLVPGANGGYVPAPPEQRGPRGQKEETLDDLLPEAFAAVREASRRTIGLRHFDVQLVGGMVLHQGKIAEMRTGEGKTLVASLPLYLNALLGKGAHLVTPNDYLSRVGGGWMGPVYLALGISVGVICSHPDQFAGIYDPTYTDPVDHGDERLEHWRPVTRQQAYRADITYGTNNEFGFDYLRDNMEMDPAGLRQRELTFAIVDEVDSILVDEARTPLIISGPAEEPPDTYFRFAEFVAKLREEEDFTVDLKMRSVLLTDDGIAKVEKLAGVDNIYSEQNYHLVHYLEQALKAQVIFRRDRDYVLVKDGRVLSEGEHAPDADIVIVDEFTGRLMFGRRYSEGLHQAIEAKERVRVQRENLTYATITFQNYFRLYRKLAGMTGTASTEAEEFRKIYNLEVVTVPTNRPMVRQDLPDLIYKTDAAKLEAIADEIEELAEEGRPVLVGTTSVEKSERLSTLLRERGIAHQVLNAKYHEQEASIIAQAGRKGAVTIATNMAGRGTDIILGGSPPDQGEADGVRELGGLHIIGSERHEARRIDNQLRGRAGRQGDPGSSRFYLSLEDDLMRRFGSDRIAGLMDRLGLEDDQPIEHSIVSRSIEQAQQKVEGYNFDMRKHTVEYDDVMNKQREVIYGQRRKIMESEEIKPIVMDVVRHQVERLVEQHADTPRPEDWDLEGLYAAVTSMFGMEVQHGPEELDGIGRDDLTETILAWAEELYEAKEAQYSPALMQLAARGTLLRIIDSLWVEHLTAIDDMIAGIGLRAYGQRDPLTEYKGEAYRMFQNLLQEIQSSLANAIFRIQFVAQPYAETAGPSAPALPEVVPLDGAMTGGDADVAADGVPVPFEAPAVRPSMAGAVATGATGASNGSTNGAAAGGAGRSSASQRRMLMTNRPADPEPQGGRGTGNGRPVLQEGRAVSRSERRKQEKEARRQKPRGQGK
jgi:preprotein translocase subunit SecA